MEDLQKSWATVGSAGILNQADLAKVTLHQSIIQLGTELLPPPSTVAVADAPAVHLVHLPTMQAVVRYNVTSTAGLFNTGSFAYRLQLRCRGQISAKLIEVDDIVIDAKSGVTGAGRGLKQNTLFSEAGEGLSPYSVGTHRHSPEIEQEIGVAAGSAVVVNFTPHLIPMSRGELCTSYVKLNGASADDLRAALEQAYRDEPFVHVAKKGVLPQTQNVRGSNYVQIGVFADRIKNRAIVISVLDNLVKGSAGQAIQNMNLMLGFPEITGLEQIALFP